ncbi:conserved hypothetical protein [Flavobacterium sp. 9R]|uniref:hypothetical protein n=1 Tax=Flavobacterium sp. 9R TaxID=2653143 RepID=UPI0012EEEA6F|nr:hypothetical protein [Flavobacterium sp. 9R]VXB30636.1 conserved hypothetical protein [Flavobacterium sp. 9R]
MLSKGLRDKESTRIDNCLKQLHSLVLPPLDWNLDIKEALELELKDFAMDLESLNDFTPEDLVLHLQRLHFDWNQMESFADFLIAFSEASPFSFSEKALAIYRFIQKESKVFSFGINAKIAALTDINTNTK